MLELVADKEGTDLLLPISFSLLFSLSFSLASSPPLLLSLCLSLSDLDVTGVVAGFYRQQGRSRSAPCPSLLSFCLSFPLFLSFSLYISCAPSSGHSGGSLAIADVFSFDDWCLAAPWIQEKKREGEGEEEKEEKNERERRDLGVTEKEKGKKRTKKGESCSGPRKRMEGERREEEKMVKRVMRVSSNFIITIMNFVGTFLNF